MKEEELKKEIESLEIRIKEYKQQLWDLTNRLLDTGYCELDDLKEELSYYKFTEWLDEE